MEKINNYNFIVFTRLFKNENATSVLLSKKGFENNGFSTFSINKFLLLSCFIKIYV